MERFAVRKSSLSAPEQPAEGLSKLDPTSAATEQLTTLEATHNAHLIEVPDALITLKKKRRVIDESDEDDDDDKIKVNQRIALTSVVAQPGAVSSSGCGEEKEFFCDDSEREQAERIDQAGGMLSHDLDEKRCSATEDFVDRNFCDGVIA